MPHQVVELLNIENDDEFFKAFYPADADYSGRRNRESHRKWLARNENNRKSLRSAINVLAEKFPAADFVCRRDGVQRNEMFHLRAPQSTRRQIVVVWNGGQFMLGQSGWMDSPDTLVAMTDLQNQASVGFLDDARMILNVQGHAGRCPRQIGFDDQNGLDDEEGLVIPDPNGENRMEHSLNIILYGPPGTGKTHSVTEHALARLVEPTGDGATPSDSESLPQPGEKVDQVGETAWQKQSKLFAKAQRDGRIEFTTFHQNYAYEDFVEGLRAQISGGGGDEGAQGSVSYSIEPGVLKRIADRAMYAWLTGKEPSQREVNDDDERKVIEDWFSADAKPKASATCPGYVLIIDEINRGNIARIFGELITLVEESKRARNLDELKPGQQPLVVTLPYSKKPFVLPPNLYIIGTMNTADRSLIGLDAALRRRFDFIEMRPQPDLLSPDVAGINLQIFLKTLNERIAVADTREHAIGHAYLMGVKDVGDLAKAMRTKILPQLREYFHQRPEELAQVFRTTRDLIRNESKHAG